MGDLQKGEAISIRRKSDQTLLTWEILIMSASSLKKKNEIEIFWYINTLACNFMCDYIME